MPPKVLLMSPPWHEPRSASLALATLGPLLDRHGIANDLLYGATLFPYTRGHPEFLNFFSAFLFAPHMHRAGERPPRDLATLLDAVVAEYVDHNNAGGIMFPRESVTLGHLGGDEIALRAGIMADIERAGEAIDRCVAAASDPAYDIVGFSVTCEAQVPAAVAIAARLKARRPDLRLVMGGAACFDEQGLGMACSFPVLDAVCHGEGEKTVVALVRALRESAPLSLVPGIAYLDDGGELRSTPRPPPLVDLDALPVPSYDSFIEQLAASEWSGHDQPALCFETSRGCWWGQKHPCTFCGLNPGGLVYRRKSPERAFREIEELRARYPGAVLQAADNVLDHGYLRTLVPRLARSGHGSGRRPRIFFEVKSNLRRAHLADLAEAGITDLQPGIEAFSDGSLALMRKGATAVMQVRFLKWAQEAGLTLYYNIIVRSPGEKAQWYEEAARLLPYVEHLQPPVGAVAMMLQRFGPMYDRPEDFGIARVRPKAYYRTLYPDPRVDVDRIAYVFDFDHPSLDDAVLVETQRVFLSRLLAWRRSYRPHTAWFADAAGAIKIEDRRQEPAARRVLGGVAREVYLFLDPGRPWAAVAARFPMHDPAVLRAALATWSSRRLAYRDERDRWVSVVPQMRPRRAGTAEAISEPGASSTHDEAAK